MNALYCTWVIDNTCWRGFSHIEDAIVQFSQPNLGFVPSRVLPHLGLVSLIAVIGIIASKAAAPAAVGNDIHPTTP